MAKAIYRQPDSLWMLIARTGNVSQALQATSDLVIAGQRAHALQARLEADLAKLQAENLPLHVERDERPEYFQSARMTALVRETLAQTGLPARRLELEITESGKLDTVTGFERGANLFEKVLDHVLGLTLVETNSLEQKIGQFGLGQCHINSRIKFCATASATQFSSKFTRHPLQ